MPFFNPIIPNRGSPQENGDGEGSKVDIYDRDHKKKKEKDPEKLKAIFSNSLEHSVIPPNISNS